MTIDNKIIQGLWIGGTLSVIEQLCIQSFIANGHEFHLYTYGEVKNIPEGTIVLDANDILLQKDIFRDSRGSVATYADYFRYKLLYQKGGWWVDLDVFCLQPFDIKAPYSFASETREDKSVNVANCIFKCPPQSPLLLHCIESITQRLHVLEHNKKFAKWHSAAGTRLTDKIRRFIARNWIPKDTSVAWGEFGPWFLDAKVKEFSLENYILAPEIFCPVPFYECYQLICQPTPGIAIPENALSVHYWNEMFNIIKLNKNAIYNENSIVEQLKRKYHVMPQL